MFGPVLILEVSPLLHPQLVAGFLADRLNCITSAISHLLFRIIMEFE